MCVGGEGGAAAGPRDTGRRLAAAAGNKSVSVSKHLDPSYPIPALFFYRVWFLIQSELNTDAASNMFLIIFEESEILMYFVAEMNEEYF